MKNTIFYICDYAKVSPAVLANRIINAVDHAVWADYRDIDDDIFRFEIFNPFENASVSEEDAAWAYEIIKPYLAEPSE